MFVHFENKYGREKKHGKAIIINRYIKFITNCTFLRLVFSRFFYIRGNLENVKEKPTRKACFSHEMKRLGLQIYLAKFCWAAFL